MSLRKDTTSRKKQEEPQEKREQYVNAVVSSREDWSSTSTMADSESITTATASTTTITIFANATATTTNSVTTSGALSNTLQTPTRPPSELQKFLLHNEQQFFQSQHNLADSANPPNSAKPFIDRSPRLIKQSSFHRYLSFTFSDSTKNKPKSKALADLQVCGFFFN